MTMENPTIKELEQKEAEIKKRQAKTQKLLRAQKVEFAKILAKQKKFGEKLGILPEAPKSTLAFDVGDKDIPDDRLTRIAELKRQIIGADKDTASKTVVAINPDALNSLDSADELSPTLDTVSGGNTDTNTRTFEWDLENNKNEKKEPDETVSTKTEPEILLSTEPVLSLEEMIARRKARQKKIIETPAETDDDLKKNSKIEIPEEVVLPTDTEKVEEVKDEEEVDTTYKLDEHGFLTALTPDTDTIKTEEAEEEQTLKPLSFETGKTKTKIADQEKPHKPISRGKFLKMFGLGLLGTAMAGGTILANKKLNKVEDNLDSAEKNNAKSQEQLAEIAEQKKRERIQSIVERMDMPFYTSLSYAGKIMYLAFLEKKENYLMLDKTKAELYTVNLFGALANKQSAVIGRVKGEAINEVSIKHDANTYGTTPAGIYTLSFDITDEAKAEFGDKAIHLLQVGMEEESNLYIHPVLPEEYKRRMKAVESPDPEDNRMSWGCINVPDVESILPYINKGVAENPKIIVLPDIGEDGKEVWMDPDMGTFYPVGEGESEYQELLTDIEKYATIA